MKRLIKTAILALQAAAPDDAWRVDARELDDVEVRWPKTLQWRPGEIWIEPVFHGLRSRIPVRVVEIPQPLQGAALIEFRRRRRVYRVCITSSDYPDLVHFGSNGAGIDLEFKMQYRIGGYGESRIVPGGFVSDSPLVDWYARRPRRMRDRQRFQYDVYGRFGLQFATEVRTDALNRLKTQQRVRFFGGDHKVGYAKFLHEVARSRVCLDLPGNGPLCFRLVNYLAVGACIVSPPHAATLPSPLVDREHVVYTRPDLSDLVELCERYANDAAAREAIVQKSRVYYRRHLYWRSLANYYLRTMLDRLPA